MGLFRGSGGGLKNNKTAAANAPLPQPVQQAFEALDEAYEGDLTFDDFLRWKKERRAIEPDQQHPGGVARVGLEKELGYLSRRIVRQGSCKALVLHLCFLLLLVGIKLCWPIHKGAMISLSYREWVETVESSATGKKLSEIDSDQAFWDWLENGLVEGLWETDGELVNEMNQLLYGVLVGQRHTGSSIACDPFETSYFSQCPHWESAKGKGTGPRGENDTEERGGEEEEEEEEEKEEEEEEEEEGGTGQPGGESGVPGPGNRRLVRYNPNNELPSFQQVLPGITSLSTRQDLFDYRLLARTVPINGSVTEIPLNETRAQIRELRGEAFVNLGTKEISVVTISFNPNSKIWLVTQVRLLLGPSGSVTSEIVTQTTELDPFSEDAMQTSGVPYEVRITLEILFAVAVVAGTIRELIELCTAAGREVTAAKSSGKKVRGAWLRGLCNYISSPANLLDITILALACALIGLQMNLYQEQTALRDLMANLAFSGQSDDQLSSQKQHLIPAYFLSIVRRKDVVLLIDSLVILFSFFRLFALFAFHPRLGMISRVMIYILPDVMHLAVVLTLVFTGFTTVAYTLFSSQVSGLVTYQMAMSTIARSLLTGLSFAEFQAWLPAQQLSFEAWIPFLIFYYGFILVAVVITFHFILALVVGARNAVVQEDAKKEDEYASLFDEISDTCFQTAKSCGCTGDNSNKPSSKVGPQLTNVDLSKTQNPERVRPSLGTMYNELCTVLAALSTVSDKAGVDVSVPVTRIEADDHERLVAVWTFAQLLACFSRPTALYLWAKYGPEASQDDEGAVVQAWSSNKTGSRQEELEQQIEALNKKLDLVLEAFTMEGLKVQKEERLTPRKSPEQGQEQEQEQEQDQEQDQAQEKAKVVAAVSTAALLAAEQERDDDEIKQAAAQALGQLLDEDESAKAHASKTVSAAAVVAVANPVADDQEEKEEERKEEQAVDTSAEIANATQESNDLKVRQLLESLVAETGDCPIQKIKHACARHQISWDVAKRVRVEMGLKQKQKVIQTDGGRYQTIRVWKTRSCESEI